MVWSGELGFPGVGSGSEVGIFGLYGRWLVLKFICYFGACDV